MSEGRGACACLTVVYAPADISHGHYEERWKCVSCKSVFVRVDRAHRLAARVAELEAERDAHQITNEESMELYDEIVVGLAAMMDDPLKPCGDPSECIGHFGEKTNKALRKAGKYLRDLQADRDRLAGALDWIAQQPCTLGRVYEEDCSQRPGQYCLSCYARAAGRGEGDPPTPPALEERD